MLKNCSVMSSQGDIQCDIYKSDKKVMALNSPEISPLTKNVNRMTNSTKNNDQVIYVHPDCQVETAAQPGLLKRLLIGALILTGGTLAVGSGYILGRARASCRSEKGSILHSVASPVIANTVPRIQCNSSILPLNGQEVAVNSTATPETSVSPYSYYEGIYGDTVTRDRALESTTRPNIVETTEAAKTKYRHENGRSLYYNTVPRDIYFPLGRKLYNELAYFCSSDLQIIVFDAYKSDPESRCQLLGKIVDKIGEYKFYDTLLRDANIQKETLSADEHAEEIMARRKLTTAYLAAECVIERKDLGEFYITAMTDNKYYSEEELIEREGRIMNYFPTHYAIGECLYPA